MQIDLNFLKSISRIRPTCSHMPQQIDLITHPHSMVPALVDIARWHARTHTAVAVKMRMIPMCVSSANGANKCNTQIDSGLCAYLCGTIAIKQSHYNSIRGETNEQAYISGRCCRCNHNSREIKTANNENTHRSPLCKMPLTCAWKCSLSHTIVFVCPRISHGVCRIYIVSIYCYAAATTKSLK